MKQYAEQLTQVPMHSGKLLVLSLPPSIWRNSVSPNVRIVCLLSFSLRIVPS